MLYSIVKPNNYQDSLRLTRLSSELSAAPGVDQVSVMMGTEMNKDYLRNAGLATPDLDAATAADLLVVADVRDEESGQALVDAVAEFLSRQAIQTAATGMPTARSLPRALQVRPDANLAMISIPGEYAAAEARRLLEHGINVLVFSDNVSIDDEIALKQQARDSGLLMMGPDCGTACIGGVPLGFGNAVATGTIGLAGASGTGIQEVMARIDELGGGISHTIGLGGRDLSAAVGGLACTQALRALDDDPGTDAIVLISKPPDPEVRARVVDLAAGLSTPVVAVLVGERPQRHGRRNVRYAHTLDDAARTAMELAGTRSRRVAAPRPGQRLIKAYYTGGTFAAEAASLIVDDLGIDASTAHEAGVLFRADGHKVIDLGDDAFTRGKPHPMIDPSVRNDRVATAIADPQTAAVVLDVVLGYGAHPDPAGVIAPVIADGVAKVHSAGRDVAVAASVCGTDRDPQVRSAQVLTLEQAGATVMPSNASAVRYALNTLRRRPPRVPEPESVGPIGRLLSRPLRVINIGLREFTDALIEHEVPMVQYDWSPVAGGDQNLQRLLEALR